jgi:pimeloyl-ACP methyl ester carboxylesterase
MRFTVNLGASGTAEISAAVLTRQGPPAGETVLVVPGFAQTAASFDALARGLFDPGFGNKVQRVIVLDMPSHGRSGNPSVTPLGFLMTADYVNVLLESLRTLNANNIRPTTLIGHSLGGEIVLLTQQRLIDNRSSLRQAFGVSNVVLLAPALPAPLPWAFADSGAPAAILLPWLRFDPVLGPVIDFPPPVWRAVFYQDLNGVIPAGAPTEAQIVSRRFHAVESAVLGNEITALPRNFRPFIGGELFVRARGTVVGVVALSQDILFRPQEEQALYTYITGDKKLTFFTVVTAPDAVHNLHTFKPEPLLHAIKKVMIAPR